MVTGVTLSTAATANVVTNVQTTVVNAFNTNGIVINPAAILVTPARNSGGAIASELNVQIQ